MYVIYYLIEYADSELVFFFLAVGYCSKILYLIQNLYPCTYHSRVSNNMKINKPFQKFP